MAVQNIDLWVSAGSFEAPYYRFYTDSGGSQELSDLSLDTSKSYTFRRLNKATSHPFYLSDTAYKANSSNALLITGNGSPSQGITGNESFKVEFVEDSTGSFEKLLYYCSSHQSMQGNIALSEPTPEPEPEPTPEPQPEPEPDCSDSTDVFRFYNAGTGVHFFTPSPDEADDIISKPEWGYKYEGVAYKAPTDTGTELYRFFNREKGYHFLTASKAEADSLTGKPEWGYNYEGRSYKVSQQATSETPNEVRRFYNPGKGIHFYSASDTEANNIIANSLGSGFDLSNALKVDDLLPNGWGYIYEGAAWYVTDC